ncbi:MAG: transcriptional regulator with XRE-family HTH domain [Acidimicrobiales bacterium]
MSRSSRRASNADVGPFIREQRRMAELSVRRLAEMAGVSNPYLSQIERGLRRPSADILQQIAKALQISAESLYVRAGILDDDRLPLMTDVETAIRQAPELTADQRRAMLSVYRSFALTAGVRGEGCDIMADVTEHRSPQAPHNGAPEEDPARESQETAWR